jgi:hypothetical protein
MQREKRFRTCSKGRRTFWHGMTETRRKGEEVTGTAKTEAAAMAEEGAVVGGGLETSPMIFGVCPCCDGCCCYI